MWVFMPKFMSLHDVVELQTRIGVEKIHFWECINESFTVKSEEYQNIQSKGTISIPSKIILYYTNISHINIDFQMKGGFSFRTQFSLRAPHQNQDKKHLAVIEMVHNFT